MNRAAVGTGGIARNTIFLYVRMLFVMGVSLFTVRVVFRVLGEQDYGINTVVSSLAALFVFLNTVMASATQRFLSLELGRGDRERLNAVFDNCFWLHAVFAALMLILLETAGLWMLHGKLQIPPDRLMAAEWLYQFCVGIVIVSVMQVPFNSVLIAREAMGIYAALGISEAVFKLGIVCLLWIVPGDKLIVYGALYLGMTVLIALLRTGVTLGKFPESRFRFTRNRDILRKLGEYLGWNTFLHAAINGVWQGTTVLVNLFFLPPVLAALGIALQIRMAMQQFLSSFQLAVIPRITKSYAQKESDMFYLLLIRGSKYCFLLLYVMVLPLYLEMPEILALWLKTPPEYAVSFSRLVLLVLLSEQLSGMLGTGIQARGALRLYTPVMTGLILLNLPLSYLFLRHGFSPSAVLLTALFLGATQAAARLALARRLVQLPVGRFLRGCWLRILPTAVMAPLPGLLILRVMPQGFWRLPVTGAVSVAATLLAAWCFTLAPDERKFVVDKIRNLKNRTAEV